jgi:carbonic anhydrase/acetyltransferase-like protein (isoleucine patch superfamily)
MATIIALGTDSPSISPNSWLAPNATIIGKVRIGENSNIFYGAVLRADVDTITIGAGSNIQDNVTIHCDTGVPTSVGNGVSVGHGAILHGCTVENDCLIGMGATVLNGAVIGAGSLVAAGAVVLEGTVVPPGSLVAGVPAKVRRELTEDERAKVVGNATHYLDIAERHRSAR